MKKFKLTDLDGVGAIKAKKLEGAGINTPLDVIIRGSKEFSRVADIPLESAEKLLNQIKEDMIKSGEVVNIDSVDSLRSFRLQQVKLPTGCSELDKMLHGGFETQCVYELYGPEGSGKTQITMSATVEALNAGHYIHFIDCEGTFDLDRLDQIAAQRGINLNEKKLGYTMITDSGEFTQFIEKIVPSLIENNTKFLIVDGMVGLFRVAYEGRGELYDRQNEIERVLKHLRNIAVYLNCSVLLTNQVQSNPDPWGEKEKPIGGHVFGHFVKYIIAIKKGMKNNRIARLIKSPRDAMADYPFYLTDAGVSDTEIAKKKIVEFPEKDLQDKSLLLNND